MYNCMRTWKHFSLNKNKVKKLILLPMKTILIEVDGCIFFAEHLNKFSLKKIPKILIIIIYNPF